MALYTVPNGNSYRDESDARRGNGRGYTSVHTRVDKLFNWSLAALLTSAGAYAQTQTLTWEAPADCPQREQVLASVRDIAGEAVMKSTSVNARGRIQRVNGGFRLQLEVMGEGGAQLRTIDAQACDDLRGAAAVVLGLNLKRFAGVAQTETPAQTATGAPVTTFTAAPNTSPPSTATSNPPSRNSNKVDDSGQPFDNRAASTNNMWVAVPQVNVSVGSLPQASLQWGAGFGFRSPAWRMSLSGRYQPVQVVASESEPGAGASVARVAAELGLARSFDFEQFECAPGVLVGMDYLMVKGTGDEVVASRASSVYPFVGAGVSVRWFATSWLSVAANLVGEVPLSRPRLTVDALGEVEQMGSANGRLAVGSEWNF